jgi:secondary thiamine-phosphate synthase enzyme
MIMHTSIDESVRLRIHRAVIRRIASEAPEFIDITADVVRAVEESGIREGTVLVFSRHTTAAVKINENEPLLLRDMARFLEEAAPREGNYRHNDFVIRTANMTEDECPNGHAHCQHLLLGVSEAIPVSDGKPLLGRWQSIFLIELDRPRAREVVVQVQGW